MRDERGTSFLIVTHDPLMEEFVDRFYRIGDGRLEEAASPAARSDAAAAERLGG
jgi:ABC-type lipoprotein export system ATPase subunit